LSAAHNKLTIVSMAVVASATATLLHDGVTLVNLAAGALNLLPGAGYFLFSGIIGVGDWQAVIDGCFMC
jgi:hypothetical protein